MTDMDLSAPATTVAKLEKRIADLSASASVQPEFYTLYRPEFTPVSGRERELHDLMRAMIDLVKEHHPAKNHVVVSKFAPEEALIHVDFNNDVASVIFEGERVKISLEALPAYWLETGHKP